MDFNWKTLYISKFLLQIHFLEQFCLIEPTANPCSTTSSPSLRSSRVSPARSCARWWAPTSATKSKSLRMNWFPESSLKSLDFCLKELFWYQFHINFCYNTCSKKARTFKLSYFYWIGINLLCVSFCLCPNLLSLESVRRNEVIKTPRKLQISSAEDILGSVETT